MAFCQLYRTNTSLSLFNGFLVSFTSNWFLLTVALCADVQVRNLFVSLLSVFDVPYRYMSSKSLLSSTSVPGPERASAAWCWTPDRCTILKSYSDCREHHCACLPEATHKFSIHLSESLSVPSMKRVLLRYRLNSGTAQKIARRSPCIVSYARSALMIERDPYLTVFVVL